MYCNNIYCSFEKNIMKNEYKVYFVFNKLYLYKFLIFFGLNFIFLRNELY